MMSIDPEDDEGAEGHGRVIKPCLSSGGQLLDGSSA
jgi:hypothetical protein